jgi:cell division protein FtsB
VLRRRLPVRPGVALAVVVLVAAAFLYARPIASYLDTRDQLAARRAEVARLRAEKAEVTARLQQSTSLEALAREARQIGQVRPGEQLFIVKGIDDWRRRTTAER